LGKNEGLKKKKQKKHKGARRGSLLVKDDGAFLVQWMMDKVIYKSTKHKKKVTQKKTENIY
jgi:hypothetical protein